MPEFLTTKGTSYHLEDIIIKAKNELFLISPYLQISKSLLERLREADKQQVKITLIYGKDELNPDRNEKKKLQELRNLSLYFFKDVHAKCFFNEESMVITSMNMYEFSENNNREMGVLIHADEKVYSDAVKEAKSILNLAKKDSSIGTVFSDVIKEPQSKPYSAIKQDSQITGRTKTTNRAGKSGHCISCGIPIPYDKKHPLCDEHFKIWERTQSVNLPFAGYYCYTCGEKGQKTTKARPECSSCFPPKK